MVRRAKDEGPQTITVHGREAAVVLSKEEYDRLSPDATERTLSESLLSFFQRSPLWESGLDIERRDEPYIPPCELRLSRDRLVNRGPVGWRRYRLSVFVG